MFSLTVFRVREILYESRAERAVQTRRGGQRIDEDVQYERVHTPRYGGPPS